jgi:hypothetical protein
MITQRKEKVYIWFEESIKDNSSPKYKFYEEKEFGDLVKFVEKNISPDEPLHPLEISRELKSLPNGIECRVSGVILVLAIKDY